MKEIDEQNMDTAITLGDAVCHELGICCETRGRVIFQIYKKLGEMKTQEDSTSNTKTGGNETNPPTIP